MGNLAIIIVLMFLVQGPIPLEKVKNREFRDAHTGRVKYITYN